MSMVNEKDYSFVKRTEEENKEVLELLSTASDKLVQAIHCIQYSSLPSVNKGTIGSLHDLAIEISTLEDNIRDGHTVLLKPLKKEEKKYQYYELYYFRGRKDTGSIYVKTELVISDFIEEDDFLMALVNRGELDESEVDSITGVNAIDADTYHDMTGK